MADILVYNKTSQKGRYVLWIFIALLVFLVIFFPLFGHNLRYQVGSFFDQALKYIGYVCFFGGVICLCAAAPAKKYSYLIVAILLLFLGLWLTGFITNFFGDTLLSNPGYR